MAHGKYHEKASSIEVLDLLETNSDLNEYRLNPRSTTRSFWVWLLHASLLLGNGLWAISTTLSISSRAVPSANFPPLDSITRYSKQLWTLRFGQPTIYTNGSNSQVDAAWDEISAPPGKVGLIKVSTEDLRHGNLTSVPLADGSGYIATVDVFHQLHCLNQLRQVLFPRQYSINDTESKPIHTAHIAHCLDSIRLSLQCNADTSLLPFGWSDKLAVPLPFFRSWHTCKNWDDILLWGKKHKFDPVTEGASFVHPRYGLVKIDGSTMG